MAAKRPQHQKELGRKVEGYDEQKWNSLCKDVVKKGNMAKVITFFRLKFANQFTLIGLSTD